MIAPRHFRWTGYCTRCGTPNVELETRYEHGARPLCDSCAAEPPPRRARAKRARVPCDGCGAVGTHGGAFDPSKPLQIALLCDRCYDARGRS